MRLAVQRKAPWQTHEYLRIVSAVVREDVLIVDFEDGAQARLHLAELPDLASKGPDWERLAFNTYELVVPSQEGDIEISSFNVRALTDPAFDRYLAEKAAESARRIGRRVRELRAESGLAEGELAERAGLSLERLAKIEAGTDGISLPTLERIVTTMGHDMGVFVVRDQDESEP